MTDEDITFDPIPDLSTPESLATMEEILNNTEESRWVPTNENPSQWIGNFWCDEGPMFFGEQERSGFEWDRDDSHEESS